VASISEQAYKQAKKRLRELEGVRYNTARQGYEVEPGQFVDAQNYQFLIDGQKEVISNYEQMKQSAKEQRAKTAEAEAGTPALTAEQERLGDEYRTLAAQAQTLTGKIKTVEDGVKAIQAWQKVQQFAEANPTAGFFLQTGSQGSGSRKVRVGSYQRLADRAGEIQSALSNAQAITDAAAQKGVTRTEVRIEGSGAAATRRNVVVVDNPAELDRRRRLVADQTGIQPATEPGQVQTAAAQVTGATTAGTGRAADINVALRQQDMVGAPTPPAPRPRGGTGGGGGGTGGANAQTGDARSQTAFLAQVNQQFGTSFKTVQEYLSATGVKGMASKATRTKRWNEFVAAQGDVTGVEASAWLQAAKAEFGWVASLYETDDSIRQLLDTAVKNKYSGDKFLAEFYKTTWYTSNDANQRNFVKMKNSDGWNEKLENTKTNLKTYALGEGFNFSDATLTMLAENQLKFNWNEQTAANAVGAEFVRQSDAARAQGMMLTGQTDIKTTTTFQKLKSTASQFLLKPEDGELEQYTRDIISGNKSEATFSRDMAARAKIRYSTLSDYIDQGYDLRSVTADYRQTAAQLLEKNETDIDFTDPKFAQAFAYTDPATGKARQMNLQEFGRYVRSLPEWGQTENAKNTYRDVAFSIAQAFGQVQ
jgi:hypothetical protein